MRNKQKQLKIKGKKAEALEDLKPKEQTKSVERKSNNQSRATIIFSDLIYKKNIMDCKKVLIRIIYILSM